MSEQARQVPHGGFDAHRPPPVEVIDDCVHCGFCLPACPTYLLWGEEMDSPRGRIYQMKLIGEGQLRIDATTAGHFDACLGCMACVTACPSGVRYDQLIEAVRPQVERNWPRSRTDRMFRALVFWLFPYPRRLRVAAVFGALYQRLRLRALADRLGVLRRLPARLRALEALLPPVRLRAALRDVPERTAPPAPARRRVGLVTGCVQRVFFGHVNAATVRVLAAEGCEVLAPRGQGCCGALSEHAGREPQALDLARAMVDTFDRLDVDTVVVNVAGCGSALKEYGRLLADDPAYAERAARFSAKVRDVTELLAELGPATAPRHPVPARVAYHDACHLAHAQGVRAQPRAVLAQIPGVELTDIPEGEVCCGSAGVYNLVQPEAAEELGRRKADNVASTAPDLVATANPGCLLQIGRYLDGVPLVHPVEIVDASIRGVGPPRRR
jgi:glycolate oxidase iron-sulfur subunit